jgi:transcriptional regulator with XRE-family HTH domain
MDARWLGVAISRRRRALHLSQEAVAHAAGISARYYADVESGKRRISIEIGCKVATALTCRLQDLLDDADAAAQD